MNKKLTIVLEDCNNKECVHKKYPFLGVAKCYAKSHQGRRIFFAEDPFPKWCPLPNATGEGADIK